MSPAKTRDDGPAQPRPFPTRASPKHADVLKDDGRLRSLAETALLDSEPEEAFDRAARLATRLTGAPTALFSLIDDHRQFFKAQCGFAPKSGPTRETPLSHSFCQYVVATEEPLGVEDARTHPLLADNGAVADLSVVAYLGVPVHGRRGQVIGSLCAIDSQPHAWSAQDQQALFDLAASLETEIALRKHVAERQLLIDELNHRIRNLFAIVNGLIRLGARDQTSVDAFARQLQGRLDALAKTHHLIQPLAVLTDHASEDIALREQVAALMKPYADAADGRVEITGPDVMLSSVASTYLALALHELSTNAAKHGALSDRDGRLSIDWTMDEDALAIDWREKGVAMRPDADPSGGFGSRLIRLCIEQQLEGEIRYEAGEGSLRYVLRIPLKSVVGPTQR